MLTLHYALTKEDYSNYYSFVAWDAPGKHKKRSLYYLRQIGTIVLFTAVFYFTGLFDRSSMFAFVVIGFILLTSIVSMTGARSAIVGQADKISDNPENSSIFLINNVTISETGILLQDEYTERKFRWPAFIKKQENGAYYFLFYNASEAVIIPKKVFKSAADKALFDGLLVQFLSFDAEVGYLIKN